MSARLLREQDVLQDFEGTHRSAGSAARKSEFRSTEDRGSSRDHSRWLARSNRESAARCFERSVRRPFAAAARADLHSSHLIHGLFGRRCAQ